MEITQHDVNRRGFDFHHMEYREERVSFLHGRANRDVCHIHQPGLPEVSTLKGTKVRLVLGGTTVVQEHGKRTGACRACASVKTGTRR